LKYSASLKKSRDFRRLYAKGKNAVSPYVAMYTRKNGTNANRLGITVSSKIGGAVVRNKVRRRLKEIYRTNEGFFVRGRDIVIVSRTRCVTARYADIERDILKLCKKLELLEQGDSKR
jgi:ribonuclease P protein component